MNKLQQFCVDQIYSCLLIVFTAKKAFLDFDYNLYLNNFIDEVW